MFIGRNTFDIVLHVGGILKECLMNHQKKLKQIQNVHPTNQALLRIPLRTMTLPPVNPIHLPTRLVTLFFFCFFVSLVVLHISLLNKKNQALA
jgi:hypothetical protein